MRLWFDELDFSIGTIGLIVAIGLGVLAALFLAVLTRWYHRR